MPRPRGSGRLASAGVVRKLIAGVIMAGSVTLGLSLPAGADPTCYTGCTPTPPGVLGAGPATTPGVPASQATPAPLPEPAASVPTSGGLPVTGTDVEQSLVLASVLVVAGGVIVRRSRRRSHRAP